MRSSSCAIRMRSRICAVFRWRDCKRTRGLQNQGTPKMAEGKIKIKLVRSPISTPQRHKNIVKSLGLHKINRVVERPDTPGFRGMVAKVPHLLAIVEE